MVVWMILWLMLVGITSFFGALTILKWLAAWWVSRHGAKEA